MIISHKNKFIFIKTAKTAGSTAEFLLRKTCGSQDIISVLGEEKNPDFSHYFINDIGSRNNKLPLLKQNKTDILRRLLRMKSPHGKFQSHNGAKLIKKNIPKVVWDNYYKFCFERHPVSKTISNFKWKIYNSHSLLKEPTYDFEEFIRSGEFYLLNGFNLYAPNGVPLVDQIFKYEEIESAFEFLSEKFKVHMDPKTVKFKNSKEFNIKVPEIKITKELLGIIEQSYAREIKLLNYDINDFDERYKAY